MKLSAHLICQELLQQEEVRCSGRLPDERNLRAAALFEAGQDMPDHCVLLVSGTMPAPQELPAGCLPVLNGGEIPPVWKTAGRPVLAFAKPQPAGRAFNLLQAVFLKYQAWEETLQNLLTEGADVEEFLLASAPFIGNPMAVVNAHMDLLGAVLPEQDHPEHPWQLYRGRSIPPEYIDRMHIMEERNSFGGQTFLLHDPGCSRVYGINFYRRNQFAGCLSMTEDCTRFTRTAYSLLSYLAAYVQRAMEALSGEEERRTAPARRAITGLLEGQKVSHELLHQAMRDSLNLTSDPDRWVCLAVTDREQKPVVNPDYLISTLHDLVPEALLLLFQERIVMILPAGEQNRLEDVLQRIIPPVQKIGFLIGVSDPFEDLWEVRTAYRKAVCAVERGPLSSRGQETVFRFETIRLDYMPACAAGGFTAADLCTEGMKRLLEHDRNKKISYRQTLQCFLKNQMNVSRCARELYLHRSTLEERMEHIYQLLGTRLETEDERLYCQLILRMLEEEKDGQVRPDITERAE